MGVCPGRCVAPQQPEVAGSSSPSHRCSPELEPSPPDPARTGASSEQGSRSLQGPLGLNGKTKGWAGAPGGLRPWAAVWVPGYKGPEAAAKNSARVLPACEEGP